ncbi:hypothetical protein BCR36DRAFT_583117 [Piromyces finnis]|uniref:Actin depolymerizing protein n=1 Tax=Piromyces finnis TaxID=1754191 RepID=A0A1Y1VAA9_9FUNG|nr:hypothetical protein BCR36DRAFT_583117 [Piromyces finnis]|eukprot:ORX51049.1 hypothetical protein BCR36DRAFT_583117 [Piromyces finnis]
MSLLYTHSRELNASLNELKEPSSNTDWILFGYEGDDITLINSGSNGLSEIKDEFDEECVQYALLKIFDETSKMLRYIYIAWCGEYAPPFQKANFSQHSQIIENFFKGYHVKINARCYEDVEPENIINKVQNSSFINFSAKVAPVPFKKPMINLPNKPANPQLQKLPTPNQLKNMEPTQTFKLGIKKPESKPVPNTTVNPDPTPVSKAPSAAPVPRPNPLNPRANPLAPRANPLAPKQNYSSPAPVTASKPTPAASTTTTTTNPISPQPTRANPLSPQPNRANPLSPQPNRANPLSPQPTRANPLSPQPTRANPLSPQPARANPLSPQPARANPLSPQPTRANPLSPKPIRSNPLNKNAPTTEPTFYKTADVPRVNVSTGVFDNVKIEPTSEPAVENDSIDTTARESVANVRKMFEQKPEKKINKITLKSAFFDNQSTNNYSAQRKVREERLRREQEDNALREREKLANQQRELQDEISETRKSNPLNSPKSTPVTITKTNPLNNSLLFSAPKSNPLNANSSSTPITISENNPFNTNKMNPLNTRANPLSPPKSNPLNTRANPLSPPKSNPLNIRANPLAPPALPERDTPPALPQRENPLAPPPLPQRENPLAPPALPQRANPLAPTALPQRANPLAPPALPQRENPLAPPPLPARENPLAPPPLPQRVLDSGKEKKEQEERERKEREERERKEREERERKEREERERKEREERERKEREQNNTRPSISGSNNNDSAIVSYDYEPQEENEIALVEGEIIKNIIQLDEGWWQGENSKGEIGLFPSNYVELMPAASVASTPAPAPAPVANNTPSAIALYDYDAQEDNEITFKEGDIITNLNFVTDDWWEGVVNGKCGLFPGNYVEVNK